jgi:hypothetical protein
VSGGTVNGNPGTDVETSANVNGRDGTALFEIAGGQAWPRSVDITETLQAGFTLEEVDCTGANSTTDINSGVSITMDFDDIVTCSFFNEPVDATITVEKQTLPDGDPATFDFSGDLAGTIGDGGSISLDVAPGQYTSTETVPAGWALTDITCDDADSSGDLGSGTATFVVGAGESVTCVFTNTFIPTPTPSPDPTPSVAPTEEPSEAPTPSVAPTEVPSVEPSVKPTEEPSKKPTDLLLATDPGMADSGDGSGAGGYMSWAVWVLLSALLIVGSGWVIRRQRLAEVPHR